MKTAVFTIRKTLLAAALTAAFSGAASAAPLLDFKVLDNFTADKITGNYVEVITFGAGVFDISLQWQAGQFVANDGSTPLNAATTGLGSQYGLYALYQGSGTFATVSGLTTFTSTPNSGSLDFFLDDLLNTTFTAPLNGSGAWTTGSDGDDTLLATGISGAGEGNILASCSGLNCGSFGTSSSISLTPDGLDFFTSPFPFYNLSLQAGQLNSFTPAGTVTINGSLDVVFEAAAVPEPGSLALMSAGLFGLVGFARRRKAKTVA